MIALKLQRFWREPKILWGAKTILVQRFLKVLIGFCRRVRQQFDNQVWVLAPLLPTPPTTCEAAYRYD